MDVTAGKGVGFLAPAGIGPSRTQGKRRAVTARRAWGVRLRVAPVRRGARTGAGAGAAGGAVMVMSSETKTAEEETARQEAELRLTAGERARTLVHICRSATLCTASVRHAGIPFGSHVDFVQDEEGRPVFLLANNANHTRNIAVEPRCSLFCQPAATAGQDGCRATLVGSVSPLTGADEDELRELYIDVHAHAAEALRFADLFRFYRMQVDDVLFVAGFGVTSQWVPATDFAAARPDPLAFDAPAIIARLNEAKEADLRRLSRVFLRVDDAVTCSMAALDRLGFDLRIRNENAETREYRVGFRESVSNRFDVQSALVKAFQEAWERENGFDETWEGEDARPTVLYFERG